MAELTQDQLQTAFFNALNQYGRNNPSFGGGGKSSSAPATNTAPAGSSGGGSSVKAAADEAVANSKNVASSVKAASSDFVDAVGNSVDTFRNLSKTGSNFSNDIVGMNVSAAQSRLSLNEFGDVVRNNGKDLAGLGGSVSRGTEAFGKLSKGFFDSRATDELKNLGYTSKDINEVLAVQLGTQRATFKDTEAGRKAAYESTVSLSREMDALSKLTGKSRDEQLEAMKKNKVDGEIESKFRLIGLTEGQDAEKAAREKFAENFAQAEARGMGQLAKDMFTKGFPNTEEAQMQYSLLGKAAQDTGNQFKALSKGQTEAAAAYSKSADVANAANQNNKSILQLAALGDAAGSAGAVAKKGVEDNLALTDSVKKVAEANGILLKSQADYAKALDLVRKDIQNSQKGGRIGADGKLQDVSGATRGVIGIENARGDIKSAAATGAEAAVGADTRRVGAVGAAAARDVGAGALEAEKNMLKGLQQQPGSTAPSNPTSAAEAARQSRDNGGVMGGLASGARDIAKFTADKIENLYVNGVAIGKKADGGYVAKPEVNLIGEAGPEFVVNQPQMKSLIESVGNKGLQAAASAGSKSQAGLDIGQLAKSISATVSTSNTGNMAGNMPSMSNISFGPNGLPTFKQAEATKSTIAENKKEADLTKIGKEQGAEAEAKARQDQARKETESKEKKPTTVSKTSTLDDVVKELNSLNKLMHQFVDDHKDLGNKQIRAARSNSPNVQDRI